MFEKKYVYLRTRCTERAAKVRDLLLTTKFLSKKMTPYNTKYDNFSLGVYVTLWALLMFIATFPVLIRGEGFGFLMDVKESLYKCLLPMVMVMMIHLIDTAYVMLTTPDIDKEQFRWGLVINFVFIVVMASALLLSVTFPLLWHRVVCFVITWIGFIVIKYMSIKLAKPQVLHVVDLTGGIDNC